MTRTLVFATTNKGKLIELRNLVGDDWSLRGSADFPEVGEIVEDQETFEGNAIKKATVFARHSGNWALADDTGLCVDALDGRPGVQSARYAADDAARIARLLGELKLVSRDRRTARFVCVLALVSPAGEVFTSRGTCEGLIGETPKGRNGFGYDPIFELASGACLAELSLEEKSRLSHRGAAFRGMAAHLSKL
jgi:XTP/dITP diphosphohydrolase